jgi:hypothetical protein
VLRILDLFNSLLKKGASITPPERSQIPVGTSLPDKPALRELAAVAIISASVLGLEVALMRTLSISRWHHFAYLVVASVLGYFHAS